MVYLAGLAGLVAGFVLGQIIIAWQLRDYTREELIILNKKRDTRMKYGLKVWGLALLGMVSFVYIYQTFMA